VHAIADCGRRRRKADGPDDPLLIDDRHGDEQKLAAEAVAEAATRVDPTSEQRNP
jgi:hypothetical protein